MVYCDAHNEPDWTALDSDLHWVICWSFSCVMLLFVGATADQLWYVKEIIHTIDICASAHHRIHVYKLQWERFIPTSDVWALWTGLNSSHYELPLIQTDDDKQWSWEEFALMLTSVLFVKLTIDGEVTEDLSTLSFRNSSVTAAHLNSTFILTALWCTNHCRWSPPCRLQRSLFLSIYNCLLLAAVAPIISISWRVTYLKQIKSCGFYPLTISWLFILVAKLKVSIFVLKQPVWICIALPQFRKHNLVERFEGAQTIDTLQRWSLFFVHLW